jgi:hypothetical protein
MPTQIPRNGTTGDRINDGLVKATLGQGVHRVAGSPHTWEYDSGRLGYYSWIARDFERNPEMA